MTVDVDEVTTPRRIRRRRWLLSVVALAMVGALTGVLILVFGGDQGRTHRRPAPPVKAAVPGVAPRPTTAPSTRGLSPIAAYQHAGAIAVQDGLRVWFEADLVKRWLAGPAEFQAGVQRLATLGRQPGVVGFKVADEMGYGDGLSSSAEILRFLRDTASALRRSAPGKKILVDMIVPELCCLPGAVPAPRWTTVTAAQMRGKYPQLTLASVDQYVRSATIDVLDVSTGLLNDRTYAGWGTDRNAAQRMAWKEVQRRGWSNLVVVQARKALAEAGGYSGSSAEASPDLRTWIDIPAQSGARAVDVWAWAQRYEGQTFALLDAALTPNPLWLGLKARRAAGRVLFTNFTPSLTRRTVTADLARLSTVFTDVFVAAGTG